MSAETNSSNSKVATPGKQVFAVLKKWFILPLLAALIGAMVIGRLTDWLLGPKSYKIYMAGALDNGAIKQIWEGLSERSAARGTLHGTKVELDLVDDLADPLNAERIASDLVAGSDTLMVVGHFISTQTRAALPAYLAKAKPPIPVILTTETNPDLLPPKMSRGAEYDTAG